MPTKAYAAFVSLRAGAAINRIKVKFVLAQINRVVDQRVTH